MLGFSLLVPFVIIALVIIVFLVIKQGYESKDEGEELMKNIYIYLVLFATLMMMIGGSVAAFMSLADIVSPAPYHQSFEEYKQWGPDYDEEKIKDKSEEQLRESYNEMIKREKEQETDRSINTLIKSFGWIIIPLPIFIYFQRKISRKE